MIQENSEKLKTEWQSSNRTNRAAHADLKAYGGNEH